MKNCAIIIAMDRNRLIGKNGSLPWHLPADLRRFKNLTMSHSIIMGRKTFESIGKALPGRQNIVVTRQKEFQARGCHVVHSLSEAFDCAESSRDCFIIGGASLLVEAFPLAQRMFLTHIDVAIEGGDTWFPHFNESDWRIIQESQHEPDEKNQFRYRFVDYQRVLATSGLNR